MRTTAAWGLLVMGSTIGLAACSDAKATPPPASAPAVTNVAFAAPAPSAVPASSPGSSAAARTTKKAASQAPVIKFTDARKQTREFIGYYRSITLTPEQERIKVEALSALPAPCCAKYTMATCCCPCNLSKAVWGMSAWLITEKGQGVEQVRQAARDWVAFINPNGFSGGACFKGGCKRPNAQDGCGGMDEAELL